MKLKEMQSCATDTLYYFIEVMPDVSFGADDIHIEFAPKSKMAERFKALCGMYSPDRPISEFHEYAIENNNFGNAIIGRDKSAMVLRAEYRIDEHNLRRIVFHELMHIYCAKTEIDGEHFIDVFGSGHTPDPDPEDKVYDGHLNAGYFVWNEFIAEYAATMIMSPVKHSFAEAAPAVFGLLDEIVIGNEESKYSFAMMSAYVLSCSDAEDILEDMSFIVPDNIPNGERTITVLQNCLCYLYEKVQSENPYKITEEFIADLGSLYITFLTMNSIALGGI